MGDGMAMSTGKRGSRPPDGTPWITARLKTGTTANPAHT
jgi:hypothetical protein